jgi:hypothetical protein
MQSVKRIEYKSMKAFRMQINRICRILKLNNTAGVTSGERPASVPSETP